MIFQFLPHELFIILDRKVLLKEFFFFLSPEYKSEKKRNISLFYLCGLKKGFIACVIVALMTYS